VHCFSIYVQIQTLSLPRNPANIDQDSARCENSVVAAITKKDAAEFSEMGSTGGPLKPGFGLSGDVRVGKGDSEAAADDHECRARNRVARSNFPDTIALPRPNNGSEFCISDALSRVAAHMQWSDGQGPFGAVIRRGARVLIKPNLVLHRNHGTGGLEPLVTHRSLISAVVETALLAGASEAVVGDAPLQSCDFSNLLASTGLDAWATKR
jgi:hypothetical protein